MSQNMIHFLKIAFTTTMLILFLSVEISTGYTDLDVELFNAAQGGDIEKNSGFLGPGSDINVRLGADQWTPLMTASREGRLDAVELLLTEGADPNIRDAGFKKNAYHWALQYGHRDVAKSLLDNGANRELKKPSGYFSRGMSMVAFLILGILIVSVLQWIFRSIIIFPVFFLGFFSSCTPLSNPDKK